MLCAAADTGVPLIAPEGRFSEPLVLRLLSRRWSYSGIPVYGGTGTERLAIVQVVFRYTWYMVVPVEVTENLSDC